MLVDPTQEDGRFRYDSPLNKALEEQKRLLRAIVTPAEVVYTGFMAWIPLAQYRLEMGGDGILIPNPVTKHC
jgi:hypothetical protein